MDALPRPKTVEDLLGMARGAPVGVEASQGLAQAAEAGTDEAHRLLDALSRDGKGEPLGCLSLQQLEHDAQAQAWHYECQAARYRAQVDVYRAASRDESHRQIAERGEVYR